MSTPGGMVTDSVFSCWRRPLPRQSPQGSSIIWPLPRQVGQVCWMEKKPCCMRTWPWPPQVLQVRGVEPGFAPEPPQVSHWTSVGTRISRSTPCTASSSEISRS